jgi:glycosyltransferase involved in cell wall biosynthesis
MKIALVHDFLAQDGGAERVLKRLSEIYPDAPIYVWFYDKKAVNTYFQTKDIRTSFIQKLPFVKNHYQWYLPFLPTATDSFDLSAFDVVISSSSSFIKGVITLPHTLHICYCHTPPRYLWTDTHDYIRNLRKISIIKKFLPFYLTRLRLYDAISAKRVNIFVSNSMNVAKRVRKYYDRESVVIHPPVDTHDGIISETIGDYFLAGGRLMAYKRFDLIVRTFNKLHLPLIIYGSGREEKPLRKMARKNITFLGKVSDAQRNKLLSRCLAFINPQEEDLGITPIEAMAHGRPVIAYGIGGNLETVIAGKTGAFFSQQNAECLAEAVIRFDPSRYSPAIIKEHAEQFSVETFKEKMKNFVESEWNRHQQSVA